MGQARLLGTVIFAGFCVSTGAIAQDSGSLAPLEAAATASLGGPASTQAQLEQDRVRRLQASRWPGLDAALDPLEASRQSFAERTGLNLSFDYQAYYQSATEGLTDIDEAALGQARILGQWTLLNRGGENPGQLVFTLENRHLLGTDIAPGGLAGEIGYAGVTATTFSDTDTTLSVAYWSQTLAGGKAGFVAGRIDPGDYSDILGYVNPRTTFSNFSILFSPVLPIPDPGFGIAGGGYLTDQIYALGVLSDANGSLTDVEWFPGGSEFYKYAEIGWTPERSKRFLTNVHLGVFHVDERTETGVPESYGAILSANHTINEELMIYGRLGWSEGDAPIARRAANAGFMWRPGLYDDLFGFGATVADPVDETLDTQTTMEAFYRLDLSDNVALTADVQHMINPGFNDQDPTVFGLRLRINL
ncbi:carbohydrate porin [Aliiruegeria sabulilitoris]|uniref:carbohydrate porin n=1 Tax=Aliiruegeria sabulilitoris TaxID=1510458 RepID=UPI000831F438|nr:carbohydrate porin [Aliiruegeria sabulilitoris]